jgi:hypothetical protein
MKINNLFYTGIAVLTFVLLGTAIQSNVSAQTKVKRDHLTETEANLVRDAQEIDKRIEVYVKAIDRRFLVLSNPNATEPKKIAELFGDLPTGTRAQLLTDISRILDEAINHIDDLASRDVKNKLLPKSLKTLTEACQRILPTLKTYQAKADTDAEKEAVYNAIDYAESVIEAFANQPPEEPKKKN